MKRSRQARKTKSAPRRADSDAAASLDATLWHLLLLGAATLGLYAAALHDGFVTDDTLQLLANPFITSYRYLPRLFTTDVWAFAQSNVSNYYRPLQMVVYMVEYHSFGFHPWPFHLINLLTGLAAVVVVYFLVRALSGSAPLALGAGLVFVFHPVHSEPMVWIAALPDLLCGLAIFAAMLLYHRARAGIQPLLNHAQATAVFFAGLFCKETAIVFPALLVAYEFLYRRESIRALFSFPTLRRLVPYVGALAVYIAFRVRALGAFAPAAGVYHHLTPWQNFLSTPVLFGQYVLKLFWPVNLNYYYYFVPQSAVSWKFAASVLLIAALVAVMFRLRRPQPLLSFALAWFFITLAPVLSIENVSDGVFAERYLFVPSLGFCVLVAWVWLRLMRGSLSKLPRLALDAAYACLALLFTFYVVQIERRIPDWHDDTNLLEKTSRQSPLLPFVQLQLGQAYYETARYDEAIAPLRRSLALTRTNYGAHLYLALSLAPLGRFDEANAELQQAYQIDPPRSATWTAFGLAHAALGQWGRAADCYRHATDVEPQNQLMFELLGEALQRKGDIPAAMDAWRRAIQLQPDYLDANLNLAVALDRSGHTDEAIALLTGVLRAHPRAEHPENAYANLGDFYLHRGDLDAAARAYQHALELNPNLVFARRNLEAIATRQRAQP